MQRLNRHPFLAALFALLTVACLLPAGEAAAIGLLIPDQEGVRPFDVVSHRATVTITNNAAVTTVEQVFRNHTSRPMEATFVFPIPEGGTVSDFSLWIAGKKTAGAVLEKDEARRIYESIVRRVEDPGLIEYMDGRLFRAAIFPIPPGGTQKLELKFGQILERRGGLYRYTYPLGAGKDYVTATTEKDFTLTAKVRSGLPITTVYSPTHTVSVNRKSDKQVTVGTESMHAALDRDFELFLGHSRDDVGVNMMAYDPDGEGGEDGYFMLALSPRVEAAAHEEIGQSFTFVVDTSGSMGGEKIEQARKTLAFCLKRLRPQDHFNVIRFATDVEQLFDRPRAASAERVREGEAFAAGLRAAGGTAIDPALEMALAQPIPEGQPHQVIFVTDGHPTVGETEPDRIVANAAARLAHGRSGGRLFTFGVGYELNTVLLDALAQKGRGRADYVEPGEELESAVGALYTRISSPVLTDVSVDFGGARIYDAYPNPLPDLFRGDQVVLFGRHRQQFSGPIVVRGRVGAKTREFRYGGAGGGERRRTKVDQGALQVLEFLPKLWATRKVGFLLEQIRLNGEQSELREEVIRLAKKFGLVTPYTSYLAVDDSEFEEAPPRPRPRPLREAPPRPRPRPMPEAKSEPRPRRMRSGAAKSAPAAPHDFAMDADGLMADSGEAGVAAAEATRELKERDSLEQEPASRRRWVADRTFERRGELWVEEGVEATAEATKVVAYSKEYFALLRRYPALKKIAGALGVEIVVRLGGVTYRIEAE